MRYDVEQKRHWRYWVWKRIAENCGTMPRLATVIFLSGPSPLDLVAAQKYGFGLQNIVAVDSDLKCVKAARASGCTAIHGNLHEVVTKWTDGTIHGVVADYCCGLTLRTAVQSLQIAQRAKAFAFNFQRGRETDSQSRLLRRVSGCVSRSDLFRFIIAFMCRGGYYFATEQKQRWPQWDAAFNDAYAQYNNESMTAAKCMYDQFADVCSEVMDDSSLMCEDEFLIENLLNRPFIKELESYSYRSNKVVMDTICGRSLLYEPNTFFRDEFASVADKTAIDRRLSAAKAIRTMNGAVKMLAPLN